MPKKSPKISTVKNKVWKNFSKLIRLMYADHRGYNTCVTCQIQKPWKEMQAGHFVQGRHNAILFDKRNVHPQCYSCNVCEHGNLLPYYRYMLFTYGQSIIDELERLDKDNKSFSVDELEALNKEILAELKKYE